MLAEVGGVHAEPAGKIGLRESRLFNEIAYAVGDVGVGHGLSFLQI